MDECSSKMGSSGSNAGRVVSPLLARRLAITRQRLADLRPPADAAGLLNIVRDLGCLQLDPTSAVARSHLLVLWSRVGPYDPAHLDALLWKERRLFEYWAHQASIVLTDDYPVHHLMMRRWGTGDSLWSRRVRAWIRQNDGLRRHILSELRARGPVPIGHFEDRAVEGWTSTGWTAGRNVSRMLNFLFARGKILVAGRAAGRKLWDLAERCLPDWTPRERLSEREVVRHAAQTSLRALGIARRRDIEQHYTRGRYPNLTRVLADLEAGGRIQRVQISADGRAWPGDWYVHADDLPVLDRLASGEWAPRTTLLSPFDNLICDRSRTELLFGFNFRMEIYVPPAQRQYGYFVMPILYGDRLIGRVDLRRDRARDCLVVNAMYAQPDAPTTRQAGRAIAGAIKELGGFLGVGDIRVGRRAPEFWKRAL